MSFKLLKSLKEIESETDKTRALFLSISAAVFLISGASLVCGTGVICQKLNQWKKHRSLVFIYCIGGQPHNQAKGFVNLYKNIRILEILFN